MIERQIINLEICITEREPVLKLLRELFNGYEMSVYGELETIITIFLNQNDKYVTVIVELAKECSIMLMTGNINLKTITTKLENLNINFNKLLFSRYML